MKTSLNPIFVDFPISRVDDEQRIVEGIAFASEVVPGEGGIRLKRSAMMAATADYLANGTCREMHQPSAVGKPLSVVWEGEKGHERAHLTAKIVDDEAWKKVKEEVYKGFSIGVIPRVMRGKDVETCQWWDTSLVDVGKDKEARFTVFRVDGVSDQAVEVEELPISDSDEVPESDTLGGFGEFMEPATSGGESLDPALSTDTERALEINEESALLRALVEEKDTTISALTLERDKTSEELTRVQGLQLETLRRAEVAEQEVKRLSELPRAQRPMVNPHLVPYRVGLGLGDEETTARAELERKLKEITDLAPTSDKKEGDRRIYEIQRIKHALRDIEGTAPPFSY